MLKLFFKYCSIVATIYLLSMAIPTITVTSVPALLVLGLVLLAVNLLIKPLILLLTLPISILTFGLFTFIVNAWTIMIADGFVRGVTIGGFLNSLLASFIIVILQHMLRDTDRLKD